MTHIDANGHAAGHPGPAFALPFLSGHGGLDESRARMTRALGWLNWMHVPVLTAVMLAMGRPCGSAACRWRCAC